MNIKEANKELEKLENEYNYWLEQKENLQTLVMPKATDIRPELVQGGKREDKLLKYVEQMDIKKINETLDYIWKRKQNIMNYIDTELKIMGKYGEIEKLIIYYKEVDIKERTWEEISQLVHYSKTQCRNIYRRYKKMRNI